MSSSPKAIIIPLSPKFQASGSILSHKFFSDKKGAVLYEILGVKPRYTVNKCFLYDVKKKAVTYKADVEYMKYKQDIEEKDEEYLPGWRRRAWDNDQGDRFTWFKLRNIQELKKGKELGFFVKDTNGEPVKRVQNVVFVEYKKLVGKYERISYSDYVDNIIFNMMESCYERDIEEILYYYLLNNGYSDVYRQFTLDPEDRPDLILKNSKDEWVIIELKKDVGDIGSFIQLKRYLKQLGDDRVKGIIMCRDHTHELTEAVKKEKSIELKKFRFNIEFDLA